MRINKYIALATGLSRRGADSAIASGRVLVNGQLPTTGSYIGPDDIVTLDGSAITPPVNTTTIMLNKPEGYVCSREGQGSKTIYDLLPVQYHRLKPIGRLDKNSSGLLLMTDDGQLAQSLTHPSRRKNKIYEVMLNKPLQPLHRQMIEDQGIILDDGLSRLQLERLTDGDDTGWRVTMHEGRNRQIRRTFGALGYDITRLHRTYLDRYSLGTLESGHFEKVGRFSL